MWNKEELVFLGCDSDYRDAEIVLFGAPFDSTTSFRPGARFGPSAIRRESDGLETYSPYLDKDLSGRKIYDGGDLVLPMGDPAAAIALIRNAEEKAILDGKIPFMVGGEHLVTLGAVEAAAKHCPELMLLHFDAHTDLRDEYLGVRLSHASVIRRCQEILGNGRIFQFGIRSGERSEFEWAAAGHTALHKFDLKGLDETVAALKGKKCYLTVDLDVLDPSVFPGTGTPEPGGVSFTDLMKALHLVTEELSLVGCDVVELAPELDHTGASTAVACKIIREMLLNLHS